MNTRTLALACLVGVLALSVTAADIGKAKLTVGQAAPDFTLASTGGEVSLNDFKGHWLLLYFFVKAETPPGEKQVVALRDSFDKLEKMDAKILGVSRDDLEILKRFKPAQQSPFELASDPEKVASVAYGVLGFGGIAQRRSFLIDPKGNIAHIFYSVTVNQHGEEVIDVLRKLQAEAKGE